jgi:hypothetical protein
MSIFYDDRIIFTVINQYVSRAVQINIVFLHISKTEQKRGVRRHNGEIDRSEGCFHAYYPKEFD